MGQLFFAMGKLTFNRIEVPHKFWTMTSVLDFDAMTGVDWVKVIVSEFSRFFNTPENRCFLLPHQDSVPWSGSASYDASNPA